MMILDNLTYLAELLFAKAVVSREIDGRLKPKFCLAKGRMNMHMHPRLLAGKEKEPIAKLAQYCWAHRLK
jgi:hypothetical protein